MQRIKLTANSRKLTNLLKFTKTDSNTAVPLCYAI